MKHLLTGNEAIARGAWEAGVVLASAYPGTPSSEILENISRYSDIYSEWAPNEKVALEEALGASIAGGRSICAMKHVGLNVAADPFFSFGYTGVNAGCVIVSADDPGLHGSQNEQDNRYYARMAKVACLEPSDSQEAKDFVLLGMEISERFDIPVLLRITTRIAHSKSLVELGDRVTPPVREPEMNPAKYSLTPDRARRPHYEVEKRLKRLREFAEVFPYNRIEWGDRSLGIITSGISYQYAREVFGESASYLKLSLTHPLPENLIRSFASQVERVIVIEENEPYLEEYVRALGIPARGRDLLPAVDELSPTVLERSLSGFIPHVFGGKTESGAGSAQQTATDVQVPARPPVLCAGCPHRGFFYILRKLNPKGHLIVTGDIGCYTLGGAPPLNSIDTCICMGASITVAHGMDKVLKGSRRLVAVIGDSTFLHQGMTGLLEVTYNRSNVTVCILDNGTTAMTGHQNHPGSGADIFGRPAPRVDLIEIAKALGVKDVFVVDPYDLTSTESELKKALSASGANVVISRRPCIFVRTEPTPPPFEVSRDACRNCRACLKLGCPAIEPIEGGVRINASLCAGCGMCGQVCRFGAVRKAGGHCG